MENFHRGIVAGKVADRDTHMNVRTRQGGKVFAGDDVARIMVNFVATAIDDLPFGLNGRLCNIVYLGAGNL